MYPMSHPFKLLKYSGEYYLIVVPQKSYRNLEIKIIILSQVRIRFLRRMESFISPSDFVWPSIIAGNFPVRAALIGSLGKLPDVDVVGAMGGHRICKGEARVRG